MQRTVLTCAAGLAIAGAVSAFAPKQTSTRPRPGFGRVIDAGTGRPVGGASVIVPRAQIGTKTSIDGAFRLNLLPSEATEVEFVHSCYLTVRVAVPAGSDGEIEIGLPFDNTSLRRPGCGGLGARSKRDTAR
jgi:hypothetical protein